MIDISMEGVIPLTKAARITPGEPHVATLFRWASRGVGGVKLEVLRVGGRTCTSREAIQRFCNRLTAGEPTEPTIRTTRSRERAAIRAEAELEAQGL